MPVPSIVIASEPPLWCASFYRLFDWQRPTKNQINQMQNICILEFVSWYYAWQVKQINILCLVHAIAVGSCIAGCNVAIVKLVSLVPRFPPTTLVPLGPSKITCHYRDVVAPGLSSTPPPSHITLEPLFFLLIPDLDLLTSTIHSGLGVVWCVMQYNGATTWLTMTMTHCIRHAPPALEAATWLTARMAHFCNDPKYDMMHLCKGMSKDRILSIF